MAGMREMNLFAVLAVPYMWLPGTNPSYMAQTVKTGVYGQDGQTG